MLSRDYSPPKINKLAKTAILPQPVSLPLYRKKFFVPAPSFSEAPGNRSIYLCPQCPRLASEIPQPKAIKVIPRARGIINKIFASLLLLCPYISPD